MIVHARPIYDLLGHKGSVTAVRFSPKGDFLASGESENMVFVWKTNIDIADKELGIVPPSTEGQSEVKATISTAKTKSILKEKQKLQSPLEQMESLSSNRNGNKENDSLQLQEDASKQQRKQNVGQSHFTDSVGKIP